MNKISHLIAGVLVFAACFFAAGHLRAQETKTVKMQAMVYAEPNTEAVVLDVFTPGVSLEVLGSHTGWSMVRMPGSAEVGWVENSTLAAPGSMPQTLKTRSGMQDGADMTKAQLSAVQNRVSVLDGSLDRVEAQVERLLDRVEPNPAPSVEPGAMQSQPHKRQASAEAKTIDRFIQYTPPQCLWSNRFVMGKYFRGGEDLYGLAFSRAIDRRGLAVLGLETVYGIGDSRGQADDLIQWGLGFRYNLKRDLYWIYPYVESSLGMRHRVGDVTDGSGPLRYTAWSSGGGLTVDIGDMLSLEAGAQAVFLFHDSVRRSEGRITFSASFNY